MKSIKLKLMFLYLTLVFIVMIVIGTYILSALKKQNVQEIEDDMKAFSKYIKEQIIDELETPDKFQMGFENSYFFEFNSSNMQGSILNSYGDTIASTVLPHENYKDSSVISAMANSEGFSCSKVATDNGIDRWYNYAVKVKNQHDKQNYIIFIRADANPSFDALFKITITIIFSVLLALCLTGAIGFLFASTLTKPIISLTNNAKQLASGNFKEKLIVNSNDEIGELTGTFNVMASTLDETLMKIKIENNKMEIILHNMTDGVLAYDAEGNLIHTNYACIDLLGINAIEKLSFSELMETLNINVSFNAVVNFEQDDIIIDWNEKFINANFTPYSDEMNISSGIIIVLHDITKHKKLDNMRKDFVANVSHEIRTPLTTIKAYTETLLENELDGETCQSFLEIINKEAERVNLLANDLLQLSRFDNNQMNFNFRKVNLIELIGQSVNHNKVMLQSKMQKIDFSSDTEPVFINGDYARLNQVFCNIISNAIKYSPQNTQINIFIETTPKYYRVYIKDNGIGIPQEDVHNIFERFYRVDKTRSREMGGTGLGLSIVKEIMNAHKATISVVSKVGVGTTMILKFNRILSKEGEI